MVGMKMAEENIANVEYGRVRFKQPAHGAGSRI
jgi:hypothetical protein